MLSIITTPSMIANAGKKCMVILVSIVTYANANLTICRHFVDVSMVSGRCCQTSGSYGTETVRFFADSSEHDSIRLGTKWLSWPVRSLHLPQFHLINLCRLSAESLVKDNLDSQPDFSPLRKAVSNVQAASTKLDKEKQEALEAFEKLIKHLPPHPSTLLHTRYGRHHTCKNRLNRWSPPPQTFGRRFKDWVKSIFGFPSTDTTAASWDVAKLFRDDTWESVLEYAHTTLNGNPQLPPWLPGPVRKFIEAARRLGRSNKKLIAFERGFISEGGIKDREWYKHLGVAPGKWLGKQW